MRRILEGGRSGSSGRFWLLAAWTFAALFPILQDSARARGASKYVKDLDAFFKHTDKTYPFFDLKGIRKDWSRAKMQLWKRLRSCRSDDAFLVLVLDAVKCLRDSHMSLQPKTAEFPAWPKRYYPGLGFLPAVKNRVVVMHPPAGRENAIPCGTLVTKIDGKNARKFLEDRAKKSWAAGGFFSSPQRARLFVFRTPLRGEKGKKHTLTYLDGAKEKKLTLRNDVEVRGWPHTYNLPKDLKRVGRSFFYTQRESGFGYMYWRRIDRSVWEGIPQALAAHPDAKGWIVDLRGNGGGGYDDTLIAQMKNLPRPVAAILDAGCISAGETVARDLVNLAGARLFGAKSAGASSSKAEWTFPSGIASVRYSTRSRGGLDGKPIEFHGIAPHEPVEVVPEEALAGKNSEILRAEKILETARTKGRGR